MRKERDDMKASGWRWGLVTFCGGVTCGVVGAETGLGASFILVLIVAFIVSAFGGLVVGEDA